jgi:hypothetical protein
VEADSQATESRRSHEGVTAVTVTSVSSDRLTAVTAAVEADSQARVHCRVGNLKFNLKTKGAGGAPRTCQGHRHVRASPWQVTCQGRDRVVGRRRYGSALACCA